MSNRGTGNPLNSPRSEVLKIRESLHLTQVELARELSVSVRNLARWEAGGSASFLMWMRLRGYAEIKRVSIKWPWQKGEGN